MTDDTDTSESDTEPAVETADAEEWSRPPNGDESDDESDGTKRSMVEYLQWTAFAILVLVALIATLRFYFAASTAISRFVTRRYRPLFQATFNLALLLACGVGLSVLVRRMR